jgi:hypothetical protein
MVLVHYEKVMKLRGVKDLLDHTQWIIHFNRYDSYCHDVAYMHIDTLEIIASWQGADAARFLRTLVEYLARAQRIVIQGRLSHPAGRFEPEMRANLGYNLWIGHFVLGLDSHDTWTQFCPHEPLMKLTFGLARAEEKYIPSISHGRDYGVVVVIQFPRQRPLASVIGRNLVCLVAAL